MIFSLKILKERGIENTIENLTLQKLSEFGYESEEDPCFIQTFEYSALKVQHLLSFMGVSDFQFVKVGGPTERLTKKETSAEI